MGEEVTEKITLNEADFKRLQGSSDVLFVHEGKGIWLDIVADQAIRSACDFRTNGDDIRAMSDQELAEYLCRQGWHLFEIKECEAWLSQVSEAWMMENRIDTLIELGHDSFVKISSADRLLFECGRECVLLYVND